MAEALAHYRYYTIPLQVAMPRTFVAISVHLQAVLDLREGANRRRLKISLARMLELDWRNEIRAGQEPVTMAIGRVAAELGLEGLIATSAADPTGFNVIAFPGNFRPESAFTILQAEELNS